MGGLNPFAAKKWGKRPEKKNMLYIVFDERFCNQEGINTMDQEDTSKSVKSVEAEGVPRFVPSKKSRDQSSYLWLKEELERLKAAYDLLYEAYQEAVQNAQSLPQVDSGSAVVASAEPETFQQLLAKLVLFEINEQSLLTLRQTDTVRGLLNANQEELTGKTEKFTSSGDDFYCEVAVDATYDNITHVDVIINRQDFETRISIVRGEPIAGTDLEM